jgi:hypothetical protein
VWFALDETKDAETMEQVLPKLEAVLRFTKELETRLSTVGVDGVAGALGLYQCLRSTLDGIATAEIEAMLATIERLERALGDMAANLREIRRLKELAG